MDGTFFSRLRRNHGLEHATLHVLSQRYPSEPAAGHSDSAGFWILTRLPAESVADAAQKALLDLRLGHSQLAVHANCGTNFATSGLFAAVAAWFALAGSGSRWRDRLERLPMAAVMAMLALFLARPVGMFLQERVTTSGKPGSLEIVEIKTTQRGSVFGHRVITRG